MRVRPWALALVLAAAGTALGGCKIVPIAEETAAAAKGGGVAERAERLWTGEAKGWFAEAARPAPEVLAAISADLASAGAKYGRRQVAEGAPWTFVVSGSGRVKEKNTTSRAGTLVVTLDGTSPPRDVTLQIGPVVRGNALRDGLPFVRFEDFENQLDYADMGKALNALALKAIEAPAATVAAGRAVSFTGVVSVSGPSDKILVTPVALEAGSS